MRVDPQNARRDGEWGRRARGSAVRRGRRHAARGLGFLDLEPRTLLTLGVGVDLGDYYMFNGSPISLLRATDSLLVQVANPSDSATMQRLTAPGGALANATVTPTTLKGLSTVTLASPFATYAQLEQLRQTVAATPGVEYAAADFVSTSGLDRAYATRDIVAKLKPGVLPGDVFQGAQFVSYRQLKGEPTEFVVTTTVQPGPETLAFARRVAQDPRVVFADADLLMEAKPMSVDDPLASLEWHLRNTGQRIGALAGADAKVMDAWDLGFTGQGVLIAVIDSAIQFTHPDLAANIYHNTADIPGDGIDNDGNGYVDDNNGWDFADNDNDPSPVLSLGSSEFHGTSVAGVAAARGNNGIGVAGAAYNAQILPVRIPLSGQAQPASAFAEAEYYASGRKADGSGFFANVQVINHSYGGSLPSSVQQAAFDWSSTQGRGGLGILNFAATGNYARYLPAGQISYPAAYAGSIAVGASNDLDMRSAYSQYGDKLDFLSPSGDDFDVIGPAGITTTDIVGAAGYSGTDYANDFNGTSSATPLASGIGALLLQAKPTLTLDEVRAILRSTADKVGGVTYDANGRSFEYGSGRLNAAAAIESVLPKATLTKPTILSFAAVEGSLTAYAPVAIFTDPNGIADQNNYQATIDWGDQTTIDQATPRYYTSNSLNIFGAHRYLHAGAYIVKISLHDSTSNTDYTTSYTLNVIDTSLLAGSAVAIKKADGSNYSESGAFSGVVANFTDQNPAASDPTVAYPVQWYTASITWGDDKTVTLGTVSRHLVNGVWDGSYDVSGTHSFLRGGSFSISTIVTDVTQSVTLPNVAVIDKAQLSVTPVSLASSFVVEGGTVSGVIGTIQGPLRIERAGDFVVTIDWGDGSTPSTDAKVTLTSDLATGVSYFQVTASHQYKVASSAVMAPSGSYSIQFLVTDYDQSSTPASAGLQVVVNPAAITMTVSPPLVNLGGTPTPISLVDGESFTGTIASFLDANRFTTPSDYVALIEWGDGTTSTGTVKRGKLGVGSFEVVGTHAYAYWNYGKRDYKVTIYRAEEYNRYQSIIKATPATPIADPIRARGVSSIAVTDAPISAQGVDATGVEGIPIQRSVATFTVNSPNVTAGQYTAQINWGDGTITAGEVGVGGTSGSFVVYGTHAYAFGEHTAQVLITSRNGEKTTAKSIFTITDAPSTVTAAPVSAIEGIATDPIVIASFANSDSFANAARFVATINWGDGTTSKGTVSGNASGGYSVLAPSHTYAGAGNYTVSVTIAQTTGQSDSASNSAYVAVRVESVTGSLAAGIDSGVVGTAAITRNTMPTVVGTARANSTVELYAQLSGSPTPVLLGTAVADSTGKYTVSSSTSLEAGSYTLTVDARNASDQVVGQITPILGSKPYIIDLTAPTVVKTALQASKGRFVVTFADNVALNPSALLNAANYVVKSATTGAAIKISSVKFDTTAASSDTSRTVIVTLANGKRLGSGNYLLNIKSAGTGDAAGNTLVEKKYTIPPVNTLTPVPDYFAMYKVGNPSSVNPQVYVSPVSVNGAQAYLLYLRGRPRAASARRGR